jgi:hypothetical protein
MKHKPLFYLLSDFMLIAFSCTHNQAEREIAQQQSPLSHAEIQDKFRALVYSAIEN